MFIQVVKTQSISRLEVNSLGARLSLYVLFHVQFFIRTPVPLLLQHLGLVGITQSFFFP